MTEESPAAPITKPVGTRLSRLFPYIRAHWKELLALVLAAVPALFILLHRPSRQAAQQLLTLPGSPIGADPGATIPPPASSGSSAGSSAGSAGSTPAPSPKKDPGKSMSVNGHNATVVRAPNPRKNPPPPRAKPAAKPGSIVARLGAAAPGFREPAPASAPKATPVVKKPAPSGYESINDKGHSH